MQHSNRTTDRYTISSHLVDGDFQQNTGNRNNTSTDPVETRNDLTILQKRKQTNPQQLQRHHAAVSPWKAFTLVLLSRINAILQYHWCNNQAGFCSTRSTTDNIFTLQQILEKTSEYNKDCNIGFINFKQAFNSVARFTLGNCCYIMVFLPNSSTLLKNYTMDPKLCESEWWPYGLLRHHHVGPQECILLPTLFNIQ